MKHEAVAVRGKDERNVQGLGVSQPLLQAAADGVGLVLGLDHGNRDVGLMVNDVVGPLALAPADQLALHDDSSLGVGDLLANLRHLLPSGLSQGARNELRADVAFREASLVHAVNGLPFRCCSSPFLPRKCFRRIQSFQVLVFLDRVHDYDGLSMLGHCDGLDAGKVDQPSEAVFCVFCAQDLHLTLVDFSIVCGQFSRNRNDVIVVPSRQAKRHWTDLSPMHCADKSSCSESARPPGCAGPRSPDTGYRILSAKGPGR